MTSPLISFDSCHYQASGADYQELYKVRSVLYEANECSCKVSPISMFALSDLVKEHAISLLNYPAPRFQFTSLSRLFYVLFLTLKIIISIYLSLFPLPPFCL